MNQRPGFTILADDLTGACDTALQFRRAGFPAFVALRGRLSAAFEGSVSAYDLDTRDRGPEAAYWAVRLAAEHLRQSGSIPGYKKIDSTLRGNIGRECDALIDAGVAQALVLVPAFPAGGRTVRGGQLLVFGEPLAATAFAAALPLASSEVATIVAATARSRVAQVGLEQVRGGAARLAAAIASRVEQAAQIVVVDAEDDADLAVVAEVLTGHREWLPAGSAGLAAALAQRGVDGLVRQPVPDCKTGPGPVLTVVGSRNPAALAQLGRLVRMPRTQIVAPDGAALLGAERQLEELRASGMVARLLATGRHVVLTPDAGGVDRSQDADSARMIAESLGRVVATALPERLAGLVITGGNTAAAVLATIGVSLLEVLAQLGPGVPVVRLCDGRPGLALITKAGGFGADAVLAEAQAWLAGSGGRTDAS